MDQLSLPDLREPAAPLPSIRGVLLNQPGSDLFLSAQTIFNNLMEAKAQLGVHKQEQDDLGSLTDEGRPFLRNSMFELRHQVEKHIKSAETTVWFIKSGLVDTTTQLAQLVAECDLGKGVVINGNFYRSVHIEGEQFPDLLLHRHGNEDWEDKRYLTPGRTGIKVGDDIYASASDHDHVHFYVALATIMK